MRVSIIIPAYNEAKRITRTLEAYNNFFSQKKRETGLEYELLVVVNGTTDNTAVIARELQERMPALLLMDIKPGGKGLAVCQGFKNALLRPNDLIGFVDADMATDPEQYYKLIENLDNYDGIIASRYMPGAQVTPPRPWVKRWGSKLFFESLTKLLFGIRYYDTQCGAKLFKRYVIEKIVPHLSVRHWAFDIEILYVCKKYNFSIREWPTVWHDQAGSKLQTLRSGLKMLATVVGLRWQYLLKKF